MTCTYNPAADHDAIRRRDVFFDIPVLATLCGIVLVAAVFVLWFACRSLAGGIGLSAGLARTDAWLQEDFFAAMAFVAVFYVPALGMMWRAARRFTERPFAWFFRRVSLLNVVLGLAAGAAIALLTIVFENHLTAHYGVRFDANDLEKAISPDNAVEFAGGILVVALFAPFAEELYFRGFLLRWLRTRYGSGLAVLLSAVVFALLHGFMLVHPGAPGWIETGEIFVAGLVMGALVVQSGSLWPSYALHAGFNAAVVSGIYLWPS